MDASSVDFYQGHLNRVSRSFAACIARLESPMRSWVSLTYLICRILDTVEDANWKDSKKQDMSFVDFEKFLKSEQTLDEISKWTEDFPENISEGEMLLVRDAQKIFNDLHKSPPQIKKVIQELVGSMSAGMRYFSGRKKQGHLRLSGLKEVNQYCFFVAGIVGETLSKLLMAVDSKIKVSSKTLRDAHHFGLFLQKVNLLKDQFVDETEGRFLIPSRVQVISSLKSDAEGAMRYIESIPLEHKGYRVFCLWSLFLGLRTLPLLTAQDLALKDGNYLNKISREETLLLFRKIEDMASQPEELRSGFDALLNYAPWPQGDERNLETPSLEVGTLYRGDLTQEDLQSLGIA